MINGKTAKAGTDVKVGDVIEIGFGTRNVKVEVLDVQETTRKGMQKSCSVICNCSEPSKISKNRYKMLALFKTVFEILFGGYATPTKCVAFWRLALNSYRYLREQRAKVRACTRPWRLPR